MGFCERGDAEDLKVVGREGAREFALAGWTRADEVSPEENGPV